MSRLHRLVRIAVSVAVLSFFPIGGKAARALTSSVPIRISEWQWHLRTPCFCAARLVLQIGRLDSGYTTQPDGGAVEIAEAPLEIVQIPPCTEDAGSPAVYRLEFDQWTPSA